MCQDAIPSSACAIASAFGRRREMATVVANPHVGLVPVGEVAQFEQLCLVQRAGVFRSESIARLRR